MKLLTCQTVHDNVGYLSIKSGQWAGFSKNHVTHLFCQPVSVVGVAVVIYEVMVLARPAMPDSQSQLPNHWYSGSQANKANHLSSRIPSICIILFLLFDEHHRPDDYMGWLDASFENPAICLAMQKKGPHF